MCFSDFPACFQTFKTLCLLNYALMIRHDYDITSSLRRGALQDESNPKIEKKTVKPSFAKIEFVKSKEQVKSPRKTTIKQDYALWEVILNGDSHVPEPPAVAILDEHLLKFHSIKDAKSLWEAIKIRFGGNKESKKITILKQQYENFNNIALIMRNKPDIETLSMDDLYNKLKVYEAKIKGKSSLSSNSHNVTFVSSKNNSSINETVNAAHDIPTAGLKEQPSASSYADDITFSFFVSQSNTLQLDNEDLEQIDTGDLKEMDLKWQVAMITIRVKRFIKKIGKNLNFNRKEPVGFDKTRVECDNCHRRGHFARKCRASRNPGNRSGDNERRVVPVETPTSTLVVQDGLGGYDWNYQAEEGPTTFALMAHSLDSANSSNSELEEAIKEKDDLKEKLTKFKESSKKLTKLINSQMSANDKTGLGYDSQLNENEMPECEIFETTSNSSVSEIDEDINQAKDWYKVGIGYHVIPPPYTGNYMPPRADLSFAGLDDYVFKFKISETRTSESDSEDECVDKSSTEQDKSSNDILVKSNECTRKNISEKHTNNNDENLRKRKDYMVGWNGMKTQKLGIGFEFNKRACFICGSVNHLIKDCNFYENKMVEKSMVNIKGKGNCQRKVRLVWNNARRVNHQNFSKMTYPHLKRNFVPTAVATKLGQVLVNAAKQTSTASTCTTRPKVNTAAIRPNVNAKSSYFKPLLLREGILTKNRQQKLIPFQEKLILLRGRMAIHNILYRIKGFLIIDASGSPKGGTGFSREVTPLFLNMLVQDPEEVAILQADAQSTPIPTEPSSSKPQKKHKLKRKHTREHEVPPIKPQAEHIVPLHSPSHDPLPSDLEETTKTIVTMQLKVQAKDKGKAILIKEPKSLKRQAQIKLDEEVARQLEAKLNANVDWNAVIEQVQKREKLTDVGMTYDKIRPIFEKHYNYNQAFLNEGNEEVKVTKREVRKEKEVEIVPNDDDDDVYTNATPLASTILIIHYKIHTERNRPYFKIIRADGNHREIFAKTEPKNYSDDYLLNTLKIMFEKPNVEANIFLLVERMYPLTHFTLEQINNDVRFEVEDESEMSLELL
nr:hypothetical protein [Tanacetum cinerariifolium]